MPHVMCKRSWGSTFNRTINGNRKSFPPGEPVELANKEIESIADDLGKALVPVEQDERGKWRVLSMEEIEPPKKPGDLSRLDV
jgi:hypothetical protein